MPPLEHRNLVGVLIIGLLLIVGLVLWLLFGKSAKPVRHLIRRDRRTVHAPKTDAWKGAQTAQEELGSPDSTERTSSDMEKPDIEEVMAEHVRDVLRRGVR